MTIVEEIIIEEMATVKLESRSEIEKFIYKSARLLGASFARCLELSHTLIEYY
jgi:hypothetical protein